MLTLHPHILEQDGKKAFAVLSYEEFEEIQAVLQDYEDIKNLRAAKAHEANAPTVSLREARRQLGN